MPDTTELPVELRDLAYCNAAPLDPGRDFDEHARKLFERIDELLSGVPTTGVAQADNIATTDAPAATTTERRIVRSRPAIIAVAALAVVLAITLASILNIHSLVAGLGIVGLRAPATTQASITTTDLIVTPFSEDRIRPLDGYPILISGGRVFTGGARVALSLSDNRAGGEIVTVRRIAPIIDYLRGQDPQLTYSVSAAALGGSGIA
jgi:hypothetical protein